MNSKLNPEQIEAAAKAIAQCMDYPWEHMPEQGRATMRKHAKTVLAAALPIDFKQATDQGGLTVAARDVLAERQRQISAEGWTPEPSLKERADALMAAGHAFWQACRRDAGGGAVRWLKATDGTTIIFTRGEYAGTLLSAIGTDYQAPEIVFEQPVGDDDMGGIVASIAADTQ